MKNKLIGIESVPHGGAATKPGIESAELQHDYFYLRGWGYLEKRNTGSEEIKLVLKNRGNLYMVDTEPVTRKDVTDFLKSKINLDRSGFAAKILKLPHPKEVMKRAFPWLIKSTANTQCFFRARPSRFPNVFTVIGFHLNAVCNIILLLAPISLAKTDIKSLIL